MKSVGDVCDCSSCLARGSRGGGSRITGTPEYMAPEQIEGRDVDRRADVYAFGCLLYRCVVGDVPYRRPTREQVMLAHLNAPIPRPSAAVAGLPAVIDRIVVRALAKRPDDRAWSPRALVGEALDELGVRRVETERPRREQTRITVPVRPKAAECGIVLGLERGRAALRPGRWVHRS